MHATVYCIYFTYLWISNFICCFDTVFATSTSLEKKNLSKLKKGKGMFHCSVCHRPGVGKLWQGFLVKIQGPKVKHHFLQICVVRHI